MSSRSRSARVTRRRVHALVPLLALVGVVAALGSAQANTSHAGWPVVLRADLQVNRTNANATLVGHPGVHNELLGGNGNDTIYAGNVGDVLWGDYQPGNQSTTQVDTMYGGAGNDFFYASHGTNTISTGAGTNIVHAHYGGGVISCGSTHDIVYLSRRSRPHYRLVGCRHISYTTVGY
jgi:Ca2+-binding RTX toxin-like protein